MYRCRNVTCKIWLNLILIYCIGKCQSLTDDLNGDTETIKANLVAQMEVWIELGALQVDLVDNSRLLVGLATPLTGAIGYLSLNNLSSPVSVQYGNLSAYSADLSQQFADGTGAAAGIKQPNYFHQTSDNSKILFVDGNSCAREVDRSTGNISTVIGVGSCGWYSLNIVGSSLSVYGMSYHQLQQMWIFSVDTLGLYTYTKKPDGGYEQRLLLPFTSASENIPDVMRQVYLDGDILWHKVCYGVNRYDLSLVNSTEELRYDNSTFIRFLSSSGLHNDADPTSIYQYRNSDLQLETSDAEISLSPDKQTLMVAGIDQNRLHFVSLSSGDLWSVCTSVANGITTDGNALDCSFTNITAAVWLDSYTVLVAENSPQQFRRIQFNAGQTAVTSTLPSAAADSTNGRQTPYARAEEGTWWVVLAISIGFCSPLFIFWVVVKVIQCKRYGLVFDIFCGKDDDDLDPLTARNINYLYNMAEIGRHYEAKKTTPIKERKTTKKYRTKSAESGSKTKKLSKIPAQMQNAAEAIADKFQLPKIAKRKKKTKNADDMEEELHPVARKTNKLKPRKSKRSSVDIVHAGTTVSVPMTKTLVGRARPLPSIPVNKTL